VVDLILPITARLLEDDKPEVRQAAAITLVDIAQMIREGDLGQHVLTIILRLAHEDDKEEMRMTASELLNLLAECLGHDLCKQFVIPEVVSLAEDPVFRVRKSTALNFHNVCKVGGEHELFERLMPAFVRLSKDDMYRVRRACAESLSDVSKHVDDDIRVGVLVEIFLRLTQDPSRLVKQSILQQSGIFIATLPSRAVSDSVLSHFCSMANGPTGDMGVDNELKHYCAYSFPAVLLTIGKERWGEVKETYQTLVQCRSPNVKQTLAASLHEIAKILGGGKIVEEELVPVFEDMIQDVEAVQAGVIKYLAGFLQMLSPPICLSYLPLLHEIIHSTNPFNWRLRQSLTVQLSDLIELPPPTSVYTTLFPLVMTLLQDPVASVRRDSFKGVAKLINLLAQQAELGSASVAENSGSNTGSSPPISGNSSEQHLEIVVRAINTLARADTYQHRQLWAELCRRLIGDLPRALFEKHFVDGILALTTDPVSNVRVALAIALGGWAPEHQAPWEENSTSPWAWLMQRKDIRECIVRLAKDDRDVYLNVVRLQPLFPDLEFSQMSCVGLKAPPGGLAPILNSDTGADPVASLPSASSDEREERVSDSAMYLSARLSHTSPKGAPSPPSSSGGGGAVFYGDEQMPNPPPSRTASSSPPLEDLQVEVVLQGTLRGDDDDENEPNVLPASSSSDPVAALAASLAESAKLETEVVAETEAVEVVEKSLQGTEPADDERPEDEVNGEEGEKKSAEPLVVLVPKAQHASPLAGIINANSDETLITEEPPP